MSGSPNITMSRAEASALHKKYILSAVGCDLPPSQVKNCLLSRTPANLTAGVSKITGPPPSINPPNLPFSPSGNYLIGLSIVDGVIVPKPFLEALAEPIIDIPVIFQSAQAEQDPSLETVDKMNLISYYKQFLQKYFHGHGWPNADSLAPHVADLYRSELLETIEFGFEAFLSDLGVVCGTDKAAEIASQNFRSPVYRTHLNARPSHTYQDKHYAFHTWDMPTSGLRTWGDWVPQASDLALGDSLRKMWRDFGYTGKLDSSWKADGCSAIGESGVARPCEVSKCKKLEDLGFGMGFWWVN
jgi:carboxylesterase type B